MSAGRPAARLLVEKLLEGGGSVPLVILLQTCVRVSRLRGLVRKLGLSPKGGFRVGTARVEVLAGILAEVKDPRQLDEIFEMLVVADEKSAPPGRGAAAMDLQPVLQLRGQELATVQRELEKARDVTARLRIREGELGRRLALERENAARLRGEVGSARQKLESVPKAPAREENQDRRVRELEREIDALNEAIQGLHRMLALRASRVRDLEEQISELGTSAPKPRRGKALPAGSPQRTKRFQMPHFKGSYYKSLEGKDRRSAERALQAILLFCTEGHGYPGLEVKQIEGQRLWSLRASRKLRVYFDMRDDGDVEVLALVDREDQHTALRRLKDR